MKILFIGTSSPYGETNGMGLRTRHIAALLGQIGETSIVTISNHWSSDQISQAEANPSHIAHLQPVSKSWGIKNKILSGLIPEEINTHPIELSSEDSAFLHDQIRSHDLVWIHTFKIANLIGRYRYPHTILDADDFPSQFCLTIVKNTPSFLEKLNNLRLAFSWKLKEELAAERFSGVVVCKASDQPNFHCPDRTLVLPNGFSPGDQLPPRSPIPFRFGMIGNFDYVLNQDALSWFLDRSWESIRSQHPEAKLVLIGKGSELYTDCHREIYGMGYLDDPNKELMSWTAMLAPTRYGGGTSVKIAEAFSKRIPVVSSSHGARGYAVRHRSEILVSDQGSSFAHWCIALSQDPSFASQIAERAHQYFRHTLDWSAQLKKLEAFTHHCLRRPQHRQN